MGFSINTDASGLPDWLLALLVVMTFAAEMIHTNTEPTPTVPVVSPLECVDLCGGRMRWWSVTDCECEPWEQP